MPILPWNELREVLAADNREDLLVAARALGVLAPIGALLQDLKLPGFHLSLGHTCPEITGATWDSDVEIPLLTRRGSVSIDGESVIANGKFPPSALER